MKRLFSALAVTAIAIAVGSTAPGTRQVVDAATAPPPPPAPVSATPRIAPTPPPAGASSSSGGATIPLNPGAATPAPGASPAADERKTMDGVWEVVIQNPNSDPAYDHFNLKQKGAVLTGTFLDNEHNSKKYPVAGSVDGKNVHLVVTKDDGSTLVFNGQVDGYMDMLGMMQAGAQSIAFTAAYRPKEKFIDSISPVPGGLGGSASGGSGGYNPPR